MAEQNVSAPSVQKADPFAAFGGSAATAPPSQQSADPFAAFGGSAAQSAATTTPEQPKSFIDQLQKQQGEQAQGVTKNLAEVAQTGMKLIHHIPGLGETLDNSQLWQRGKQAVDEAANAELTGQGKGAYIATDMANWGLAEEQLAGMASKLSKVVKGANYAEKAKAIQPILDFAAKHPVAGRIIHSALQNAGMGAAFEAAHGKDDLGTAALLGGAGGAAGAAISEGAGAAARALKGEPAEATRVIEGARVPEAKAEPLTPAQQESAKAYSGTAREAARPHLTAVSDPWEVDARLQQLHDFTGVADELKQALNGRVNEIDQATGGRFKQLQDEIRAARDAGGPEYGNKLREMDSLLQNTQNTSANSAELDKIRQSWRRYYVLEDAGKKLDRAIDGLPGESGISREQRGINGKKLLTGLSNLIQNHGRATVEETLGQGRLENLEAIARANMTNAQRKNFNEAALNVAKYLTRKTSATAAGAAVGHHFGGPIGGYAGAAAGAAIDAQLGRVYKAIQANPRVAQNLLFAIESGARPENYGPLIGGLIGAERNE